MFDYLARKRKREEHCLPVRIVFAVVVVYSIVLDTAAAAATNTFSTGVA